MADSRSRVTNASLGVGVFMVLGIVVPIVVLSPDIQAPLANVLGSLFVLEISALRLSLLIAAGQPRMLWLGAHLFVYPFLGVAAFAQVTADQYPLLGGAPVSSALVADALFSVVLPGLLAFEVGAVLAYRSRGDDAPGFQGSWSIAQHRVVLLGLFGSGFVAFTLATTGFGAFFSSREEFGAALAGGAADGQQIYQVEVKTTYLLRSIATRMPTLVALVLVIVSLRDKTWKHGRLGKPATALFLSTLVITNVLANNPIANSRFWFGVVALGLLAAFVPWRTPQGFRTIALSALGVFMLIFGALDAFRRTTTEFEATSPRDAYLTDGSYSGFQTIMTGQFYNDQFGTVGGVQLLGSLFSFVPRSIWTSKPIDTGAVIDPLYNRAATLWTEFQINFGIIGVVVGMLVVGFAAVRIERWLAAQRGPLATLAPVLAGVMIILFRGSLTTAVGTIYPLVVIYLLMFRRRRVIPLRGSSRTSRTRIDLPDAARGVARPTDV